MLADFQICISVPLIYKLLSHHQLHPISISFICIDQIIPNQKRLFNNSN